MTLSVKKITRTVAAVVYGLLKFDEEIDIAGVILTEVANSRHEKVAIDAITQKTGLKVFGSIPKLKGDNPLPSRHLGLITPEENEKALEAVERAKNAAKQYINLEEILEIAKEAPPIEIDESATLSLSSTKKARIGIFKDRAFLFYYKENLEALEDEGAEIVEISSVSDKRLPEADGLYIGGGFPETNAELLTKNETFVKEVREFAESGGPIYAECGGLMYLSKSLRKDGKRREMASVLPLELEFDSRPRGHGYFEATIDRENPYFEIGEKIRGHEFHYSYASGGFEKIVTCAKVERGRGIRENRDGAIYKNVFASYFHLHAASSPNWAKKFVEISRKFRDGI